MRLDLHILVIIFLVKKLVVINEKKELLTLNKPVFIGCTVLELSKLAIYEFHYDFIKVKLISLHYYIQIQIILFMKLLVKIFMK